MGKGGASHPSVQDVAHVTCATTQVQVIVLCACKRPVRDLEGAKKARKAWKTEAGERPASPRRVGAPRLDPPPAVEILCWQLAARRERTASRPAESLPFLPDLSKPPQERRQHLWDAIPTAPRRFHHCEEPLPWCPGAATSRTQANHA